MGKLRSVIRVFPPFSKKKLITLGKIIQPPIVITETYDISIHPTVRHAEGITEQWDVRKGIYIVYDSEGHLLNMRVETIRDEQ